MCICARCVSIKPEWCIFSLKTLYIFAAEECHEVVELIFNNNTNNAPKSATTGPLYFWRGKKKKFKNKNHKNKDVSHGTCVWRIFPFKNKNPLRNSTWDFFFFYYSNGSLVPRCIDVRWMFSRVEEFLVRPLCAGFFFSKAFRVFVNRESERRQPTARRSHSLKSKIANSRNDIIFFRKK